MRIGDPCTRPRELRLLLRTEMRQERLSAIVGLTSALTTLVC